MRAGLVSDVWLAARAPAPAPAPSSEPFARAERGFLQQYGLRGESVGENGAMEHEWKAMMAACARWRASGAMVKCARMRVSWPAQRVAAAVLLADDESDLAARDVRFGHVSACLKLMELRASQVKAAMGTAEGAEEQVRLQLVAALVADVGAGICAGLFVAVYREAVGDALYDTVGFALQSENMESYVKWMLRQHAPLGFKLNKGLDEVLGETVLLIIRMWHVITSGVAPFAPGLLLVAGGLAMSAGGLSFLLALCCDVSLILTLQVQILFNFFSRLHRFQLSSISTCWNLIRGKKKNTLRKRIDTGIFDTSELLLGSVSFIVLLFIFQTTLAYYILFAGLWCMVLLFYSGMYVCLKLISCFPIVALVQVTRDRTRFPCGSTLDIVREEIQGGGFRRTVQVRQEYFGPMDFIKSWLCLAGVFWKERFQGVEGSFFGQLLNGGPIRFLRKKSQE